MRHGIEKYRVQWVDMLRGFSMLAILWFHTEMYYAGTDITPYALYVGDVLAVFFFLSGYVSYGKQAASLRHQLYGLLRWLLVPYVVFTLAIALVKGLVLHAEGGLPALLMAVLTGHASWFVAALIVARLLFLAVGHLFRDSPWALVATALLALVLSATVGNRSSACHYEADLWCVNEALPGYALMVGGWFFRRNEAWLKARLFSRVGIIVLALLTVAVKYMVMVSGGQMVFGLLDVSCYPLFLADILIVILFLVGLFMKMPAVRCLQWVGRRSLVYYFVCGGCPLLVSMLLQHVGFAYRSYVQLPVAFAVTCCFATLLVWVVYRYTNIVRKVIPAK